MYNNQYGHFRLICIISKQHLGMQSVREMEQVAHKQADLLSTLCQLWLCQPEAPMLSPSLGYKVHPTPVDGRERAEGTVGN